LTEIEEDKSLFGLKAFFEVVFLGVVEEKIQYDVCRKVIDEGKVLIWFYKIHIL